MTQACEILISGGRVIDPQNGVDAVANIAISDGSVVYVGDEALQARHVIDASGRIVAPGFVDIHAHAQNIPGHRLQAFDGVTTTFEAEAGASPVTAALDWAGSEGRPLNYGFSAGWLHTRMRVMDGHNEADLDLVPKLPLDSMGVLSARGTRWAQPATPDELTRIITLLEEQIDHGALGIGVLLGYAPEIDTGELLSVAELGARRSAPLFVHTRTGSMVPDRTPLDGIEELIDAARATGAHIHLCHFNSSASSHPDQARELILSAQHDGVNITTELYPYGFSSTVIGAAFLDPDILEAAGRPPSVITPLALGKPAETFEQIARLRAEDPGQLCLIRYYQDPWDGDDLKKVMSLPGAVFGSDAMPLKAAAGAGEVDATQWPLPPQMATHPRSTACFTRALAWLHRDSGVMSLSEVIARSTTLPAQILRPAAPAMGRKGHVGVGADADIVIFDLAQLEPNTSITPVSASKGMEHVLVAGTSLITDGEMQTDQLPGCVIKSTG